MCNPISNQKKTGGKKQTNYTSSNLIFERNEYLYQQKLVIISSEVNI